MPPHGEHLPPHEREEHPHPRREPTHAEIFDRLLSIEEVLKKIESRV